MPNKSQSGFVPVFVVILLAIIVGSSALVIKNVFYNQPRSIPTIEKQSTNSAEVKNNLSSTVSKAPTLVTSKQSTPTPTKTSTSTTSNNNSNNSGSNSNSNNNTSNPTNTPVSTNAPIPTNPTPTPTPTSQPAAAYVQVTYPNGGESFSVGDHLTITWDTNMSLGSCQMQTIDLNNSGTVIGNYVNVTNRSISWTATIGNTPLTEKQLKIYMICYDMNGGTKYAQSNNYFTVHK